ncbi:hypothetical protein ACJRO7_027783 [Eucalyptus globulus]|uniref:Squalene synthase n=1 Tax=Eucalyptus globulus TaxID=34317 RepID=A0ABD3JXH1_EUCGL
MVARNAGKNIPLRSLGEILEHPEDFYPLLKMKMAARNAEMQIPQQPQWRFCYFLLPKVSRSFALLIQQLGTELRDVCVFYLVLEHLIQLDDTSIPSDVKVPILKAFHLHLYDKEWCFSCGTKEYKVLIYQFHHVSTAFLELGKSYQVTIEDVTKRMGAVMAKFICKEVETVDDYDEYCHYVAGLVGLGLYRRDEMIRHIDELEWQDRNKAHETITIIILRPSIGPLLHFSYCHLSRQCVQEPLYFCVCLATKVFDCTRTIADVYGAFYDFSCMLKSKVDMNDPNATKTLSRIETIQKVRPYVLACEPRYSSVLVVILLIILAIILSALCKQ